MIHRDIYIMYIGKPEVRIIEEQSEEVRDAEVSSYEAQLLLQKYGIKSDTVNQPPVRVNSDTRTFEDLVREQEQEQERIRKMRTRPQNPSFGSGNYHHESKYCDMDDIPVRVEIFTDMYIPKNY